MSRLDAELHRLAFSPAERGADEGRTRAFTLSLSGPAAWDSLGAAWRGVQADLGLPPPAIAVAGSEGYQLWFAVAEPIAVEQARAFAQGLARRYLGDAAHARIATGPLGAPPPREFAPGQWSAFVTADLAGLFTEETWLDLQPGEDAQADLLARVQPISPADLQRALQQLAPAPAQDLKTTSPLTAMSDPRQFLLSVMNDAAVPLALRIEAAKALLPRGGA